MLTRATRASSGSWPPTSTRTTTATAATASRPPRAATSAWTTLLNQLTLSQIALLAGLPQSPSNYDLVRNAEEQPNGQLCVPLDPDNVRIVERRNFILDTLAQNPDRRVLTGNEYSAADFEAAKDDPICLAPQTVPQWKAPHFVWSIRKELSDKLCADAETCPDPRAGRPQDHHHARLGRAADRREVGDGGGDPAPHARP